MSRPFNYIENNGLTWARPGRTGYYYERHFPCILTQAKAQIDKKFNAGLSFAKLIYKFFYTLSSVIRDTHFLSSFFSFSPFKS